MRGERGEAGLRLLPAPPGVQHVPQRADAAVPHRAQDAHRVLGPAVRVVGLQQHPHARVRGERGDRPQPARGDRVGLRGRRLAGAGEDTYVRRPELAGQPHQFREVLQHGAVRAGRGDPDVSGEAQEFHTRVGERRGHRGAFDGQEARVHGFLRVGAQFDAVVAAVAGEAHHVGEGKAGDTEGGESQFHEERLPRPAVRNAPRTADGGASFAG
ncbi:hypothetical protein GCM10010359_54050 [Streptomyces morookaense]|nr:hypothetical protein GCM10010359_54050 [Streptomyces morookaense]